MATSTLNISLPETQRTFVEEKIKKEGYGTISEYVRQLIREEQRKDERRQQEIEFLRMEIQKGVDDIRAGRYKIFSSQEEIDEFIETVKKEGRAKLAKKTKAK